MTYDVSGKHLTREIAHFHITGNKPVFSRELKINTIRAINHDELVQAFSALTSREDFSEIDEKEFKFLEQCIDYSEKNGDCTINISIY